MAEGKFINLQNARKCVDGSRHIIIANQVAHLKKGGIVSEEIVKITNTDIGIGRQS